MYLNVLAIDLDGTLATENHVAQESWNNIQKAKDKGFAIILVTGRRLSALQDIGPFEEICEAIVAENGAVISLPSSETILVPFGVLASEVVNLLEETGIPLEKGKAIIGTWVPHEEKVLKVLSKTGYAATIEYNKGAVMVLPPGATKGTGLLVALHELGYSTHNVIACGDGENDRSFLKRQN